MTTSPPPTSDPSGPAAPADPSAPRAEPDHGAAGLTTAEADERLATHGPNRLAEPATRPAWARFADQFKNLLVVILAAAAALAAALGDLKDAVVVAVVLVGNAILGYVQEGRAETAMAALKRMLDARVRVRRDGFTTEISGEELVPGDVVLLEAGDRIPADGRFLFAQSVAVDESSLTGESVTVDKAVTSDAEARYGLGFMNTTVVRGRAELLVTTTGMDTEMGRVAELLQHSDPGPTPLQIQLAELAKRLAALAAVAVVLVFALQMLQGASFLDSVLGSVALAVAAIPEGLPAVVTLTLAVGTSQMAKRRAIVKRLASVETLGSTTVICSDKTGTLTRNQMTARVVVRGHRRFAVTGEGYGLEGTITPAAGAPAAAPSPDPTVGAGESGGSQLGSVPLLAALCSDARVDAGALVGDPTEGALLVLAAKDGLDVDAARAERPRLAEIPFDSATKYMATFHDAAPGTMLLAVKGAPDVVIGLCSSTVDDHGRPQPLDDPARAALLDANAELARGGYRVLALASRVVDAERVPTDPGSDIETGLDVLVEDLCCEALVAIIDPIRPEAREAIGLCRKAGVAVKMITGDHPETAAAIAGELGLQGEVVSGDELTAMTDEELAARIETIAVCARVSPEHKVRVVRALQANGEVVAMTGDGVNDAPALRQADIGVAMGITGTEVSKEAADLVLADDNFATIVDAVERGRAIYDNIATFVRFQVTTNLGAIITITGASLLGLPVPLSAVQVLFINIIADGPPAMTLGVDPPAPDTMQRPPRPPGTAILDLPRATRLLYAASVMAIGTILVYALARGAWGDVVATTMAFTTFVFANLLNVFNVRREYASVFHRASLANAKLWLAIGSVTLVQIAAVTLAPLQGLFGTTALTGAQWAICVATATTVVLAEELRKVIARVRSRP